MVALIMNVASQSLGTTSLQDGLNQQYSFFVMDIKESITIFVFISIL